MRVDSSLLVFVFVTLIFAQACWAQTNFQAQVKARFVLPCTGASNYNPNLANACQLDPTGQNSGYYSGGVSVAWGTGEISPTLRSNLTFTSFPTVTLGLGLANAKAIGKLSHQNYPINCFSSCSQFIPTKFQLSFFVSVALQGGNTYQPFEGTFTLFLDETPNEDARSNLNGPCTISGINQEISWVNAGGYSQDFPCCPYYTTKVSPPDPISRGGPCSDRITFDSVTAPDRFELGGTIYTLAIAGFSPSSTSFNNEITFFTSQENQLQEAFVYAYVLRQCANNAACDDGIQCTTDTCDASGLCRNTFVGANTPCTDTANSSPRYDPNNQCMAWRCDGAGACRGAAINSGSTCTNPGTQPGGTTSDCISARCNSGVCGWQRAPDGTTCTTLNTNQQNAITSDSTCNKAMCQNGGCAFFPQNSGSCASIGTSLCNKRVCKTFTQNSFTKGTCRGTFMSQGSCTVIATKECNGRVCVTKAGGLGTCGYASRGNGGSCNGGLTAVTCNKRVCSSGNCVYQTNTNEVPTSCASGATGSCSRFICRSFSRSPPGSCSVRATSGGSCRSLTARECTNRVCSSGVCSYTVGAWTSTGTGSCTNLAAQECKARVCVTKTGSSNIGTCGYKNSNEGSCFSLTARECKSRRCSSGACAYIDFTGGSCTSLSGSVCNRRICQKANGNSGTAICKYQLYTSDPSAGTCGLAASVCNSRGCKNKSGVGSCGYSASSGSCTGVGTPAVVECKVRRCVSKSANPPGSCRYNNAGDGNVCTTAVGSINSCTRQICSSGVCTRAVIAGRPACTPSFTTNDASCIPSRCVSSATRGGTCSTSFRSGGSCIALSTRTCSARRCTSSGTCAYSFLSSTTPCSDGSKGPVGSFCNPQFCDGQGTCANSPNFRSGQTCIFRSNEVTQACVTSACTNGVCLDTSNVGANNNTLICQANLPNQDSCQRYYCVYRASSQFDKQGTCLRQINPSTVDAQCSIINNPDSERDQRCYIMQCTAGACTRILKLEGTYCDTPPNTPTLNGYGCSQYVCTAGGKCDTSKTVAVRNGSLCAGVVPCAPSEPSCLGECQRFVCFNGRCQVDYFNENNNCTFIKYLTARSEDGTMEVRADNPDPTQSDQCTLGKCYQGRCKAYFVQNGTACGNRSLNNDLCYGDYCNEQGRCIVTDRKDCQGVIPLPSVCWDVTCDAKDGSCVLVSSGRIDCSCIDDCSACTGVFSLTNSTRDRTLGCYWCTPGGGSEVLSSAEGSTGSPQPSCFNRFLPGNLTEIPPPPGWTCHTDDSICGSGDDLTGGAIAGIVLGILGLTSFALLVIAVAILMFRYFAAASVPPANASLTDLAFDNNVKNNVFYEGANLDQISALYSDPHFITN